MRLFIAYCGNAWIRGLLISVEKKHGVFKLSLKAVDVYAECQQTKEIYEIESIVKTKIK